MQGPDDIRWHAMSDTNERVNPNEDLAQRKVDYWRTNEVKNLKKLLIHKHFL